MGVLLTQMCDAELDVFLDDLVQQAVSSICQIETIHAKRKNEIGRLYSYRWYEDLRIARPRRVLP